MLFIPVISNYEKEGGDMALVRQFAAEFANKEVLEHDLEKFLKNHFRSYTSAKLLQRFIEVSASDIVKTLSLIN